MKPIDKRLCELSAGWTSLPSYRCAFAVMHLPLRSGVVLDYGCGEGRHTPHWRRESNRVVGVDINEPSITRARLNCPEVEFYPSTARLPFEDRSFDAVVMLDVIEHVASEKATLEEVWRVLRAGGRLILTTPYRNLFGDWYDPDNFLFHPAIRTRNWLLGRKVTLDRHRHYRTGDLLALAPGRFELEAEEITGGVDTVAVSTLAKMLAFAGIKLGCGRWKPVVGLQDLLRRYQQNSQLRRWPVALACKLNIVLRRRD